MTEDTWRQGHVNFVMPGWLASKAKILLNIIAVISSLVRPFCYASTNFTT